MIMWSASTGARGGDRVSRQAHYRVRPFLRRDNCLERSLLTYRFLFREGLLVGSDE
jgi:hypothetical protein